MYHLTLYPDVAGNSGGGSDRFGNVINDILDIETDRISHPERALPKGKSHAHPLAYTQYPCAVLPSPARS